MGNALEFILKLTDMLTPGMRQAAAVSDSTASRIQNDFSRINNSSRQMAASVSELRSRLEAVNQVRFGTRLTSEFNNATRQARDLERQIERLEGRGQRGSDGGLGIGGLLAGVGAYGALRGTLGSAAEREQQKISFGVMTGSQATGDKMLGDIVKMGAATPFENDDLIKAAQTMKLFGIENKKILPDLHMLGDVAGGNAEKLQSLSLAFAQVQSAGRLQGQDLLQLVNAGFNPLQEISKATGKSMKDLKKEMEKSAISSDMVTAAFQRATGPGGQFYQMMEKQSQTLAGRWSTFMDNGKAKLLAFGEALMPVASGVLDFASNLLSGEPAAIAFGVAIGAVTLALTWSSIAAKGMAMWTGIMNAVLAANPIGLVVAAVALLVTGIIYAYNHFEKFRGFVWGSWEAIKSFGTLIKDFVIDKITGMVKGIAGIGETLYLFFTGQWKKAWETGKQATQDIIGVDAVTHAIENGKKIGSAFSTGYKNGVGDFVKHKGVNPTNANASAGSGAGVSADAFKDLGNTTAKKAKSVNEGGQRSLVINIGKQIERLEVHVMNAKEGAEEIAAMIREEMRKTVYSFNGVGS